MTAVATQGRSNANWMVSSYKLAYSVDGGSFTPYGEGDGQARNILLLLYYVSQVNNLHLYKRNIESRRSVNFSLRSTCNFNCRVI